MNVHHITKNDQDYTLLVFGPYADGFDVEIHNGFVTDSQDPSTYVDTVSSLPTVDIDAFVRIVL